jgi:hypothetical protein
MDEVNRSFIQIDVKNIKTGKPISFKINVSNVTMPHRMDLTIPPNKYRVDFAESAIGGDHSYGGMNYYAAKELNMPFEYGPDVVVVAKQTTGDPAMREQKILCTIAHEILEAELMSTGLPYHIAHMYAMQYEKGVYGGDLGQRDQL